MILSTIVLLGGNGYIGREVSKQWLAKDNKANFIVISRTGNNKLKDPRIHNVIADVSDYDSVVNVIPEEIDYIVDFVGRPEKDQVTLLNSNKRPAEVMKQIAENYNVKVMGFVGGTLGPKSFTTIKSDIICQLKTSRIRLEVVEPTLVYGEDRNDNLAKVVPIFNFLGIFFKSIKPVKVTQVATELVEKMIVK